MSAEQLFAGTRYVWWHRPQRRVSSRIQHVSSDGGHKTGLTQEERLGQAQAECGSEPAGGGSARGAPLHAEGWRAATASLSRWFQVDCTHPGGLRRPEPGSVRMWRMHSTGYRTPSQPKARVQGRPACSLAPSSSGILATMQVVSLFGNQGTKASGAGRRARGVISGCRLPNAAADCSQVYHRSWPSWGRPASEAVPQAWEPCLTRAQPSGSAPPCSLLTPCSCSRARAPPLSPLPRPP